MLYHMILPRAVNCWNDTHLMQVWDSKYQSTRFRQTPERSEGRKRVRTISPVDRCYSTAQDIKDQHSTSTNEVNLLALGSAAGRGDMSVVGHEPSHAKPCSYYGEAIPIHWLH